MALNLVTLTGRFLDGAGDPVTGQVAFAPSQPLTDITDAENVIQVPVTAPLNSAGRFSIPLYATDNADLAPSGWAWNVTEEITGLPPSSWTFFLPYAAGAVQDISALVPVTPGPPLSGYLPESGGTITGPVVLGGSPPLELPSGTAGDVLTSDAAGHITLQPPSIFTAGTGLTLSGGDVSLNTPVSIADGGTNAVTARAALASLGIAAPPPTGIASTDTAALLAALAALPAGQRLIFQGGSYLINAPLTPPSGATLVAARGCTITQATQMYPVFDLFNVSNVTIGAGFTLINGSGPPATTGPSFRGDSGYAYSAGVWGNQGGNTVTGVKIVNFAMGVYFNASNGTINSTGIQQYGNTVDSVEVSGCNHGVLYLSQNGLRISNLYVHDHVDSSSGGNPTHAIYGTGNSSLYSADTSAGNCLDVNNSTGHAFQFKYQDGLTLGKMRADTTAGLLNFVDVFDVTGADATSVNDQCAMSSLTFQKVSNQSARISLACVTITSAVDSVDPAVVIIADDVLITGLYVHGLRNGANPSNWEVSLRGNRITVNGLKMRNTGTSVCNGVQIGSGASYPTSDCTIDGLEVDGYADLADVDTHATGMSAISYTPAAQRRVTSPAVNGSGGNFTIAVPGVTPPAFTWITSAGTTTWVNPPGAATVDVFVCAGGGGGGSGACNATGNAGGGGGGSGGAMNYRTFAAGDLPGSVSVTVGAGGNGGAAVTASSGSNAGAACGAGGSTVFGTYLDAFPGAGGGGGTSSGGAGGVGGSPVTGLYLGSAGGGGGAAAGGAASPAGSGATGGGGGGGANSGTQYNGGATSYTTSGSTSDTGAGGIAGGAGPTAGTAPTVRGTPGPGGGGGAGANTSGGTAQTGASGHFGAGGGGGGGAFIAGGTCTSGAGGNGGSGFALIVAHFA